MAGQDLEGQDPRQEEGVAPAPPPRPSARPGPRPRASSSRRCSPTGAAGGSRRTPTPPTRTPPAPPRRRDPEPPRRPVAPRGRPRTCATPGSPCTPPRPRAGHRAGDAAGRRRPSGSRPRPGKPYPQRSFQSGSRPDRIASRRTAISPMENCVTSPPTGIRPPRPIGQSQTLSPSSETTGARSSTSLAFTKNSRRPGLRPVPVSASGLLFRRGQPLQPFQRPPPPRNLPSPSRPPSTATACRAHSIASGNRS